MPDRRAEVLVPVACALGESPIWDPDRDRLLWLDIRSRRLHEWRRGTGRHAVTPLSARISSIALTTSGGLLLAGDEGVQLAEPDGSAPRAFTTLPHAPGTRTADGGCDPHGRYWIGTTDEDAAGDRGVLYRLDAEGRIEVMRRGISMSNGIDWDPDGTRCYHVDTRRAVVTVLRLDDRGDVVSEDPFVVVDGMPDGLAVDRDGGVWVALWDGGAVHRYTRDGRLDEVLHIPAGWVTSCTFGGPEGTELYVTTACAGLSDEERERQPEAGAVFRADVGIVGRDISRFAG